MPSTYTLNNGIELIGTGEQSGTWGDTTNTNLELLDTALDGQVSVTLAATGSSGSPNTLPISDGASSNGRNRLVIFGDGGDLGGTAFVQLTPNDAEKIIYVRNNLSGSRSILLFQGTYSASNDYEVPAGTTAVVFFNGAGTGAVAANVFNNAFFDSLRLGSVSVDKILDEDNMASDDAAALATQQSIKAYVDSQVGTVDTLAEILANGNTSGGTNIQMTTTDELQFRDTALKISSSADGQLDIDADTEIEIVAPTVDIDASTAMTIDTAALTVTGAVDLNTSLNVDGTVTSDGVTVAGNLSVDGGTIKLDGNYPTGSQNVALGDAALDDGSLSGGFNTAIGRGSLSNNTSGAYNSALGNGSLQNNITANSNVGVGYQSLYLNTTGAKNVAVGTNALDSNVTGSNNVSIGFEAGDALGDEIVATAIVSGVNYTIQTLGTTDFTLIGAGANTVGTTFTATGAGTGTGTASANANYNTFVGHQSGDVIVGGSKNSILGRFDGNQNTIDIRNSDNNIVLSDGDGNPRLAYVSANTELVINEQSADVDFRVESNGNTHALFVDAGNDRVKIGSSDTSGSAVFSVYDNRDNSASNWFDDKTGLELYNFSQPAGYGTSVGIFLEAHSGESTYMYSEAPSNSNVTGYIGARTSGTNNRDLIFWTPSSVTINDDSYDVDFRVESNANTHALFVDAGNNVVGMGISDPSAFYSNDLVVQAGSEGGITISSTNTTNSNYFMFADASSGNGRFAGYVQYDHNTDTMIFATNTAPRLHLDGSEVTVNEASNDTDFRVESDNHTHMLFVDAGANKIGINNNSPDSMITLKNTGTNMRSLRVYSSGGAAVIDLGVGTGQTNGNDAYLALRNQNAADVITLSTDGVTVFNDNGDATNDFRVESDTNTHMLFVDAGDNEIRTTKGANTFTLNATALAFNRGVETGTIFNSGRHAYQFNADASTLALQVYNGAGAQVTNGAISVDTSGGVTFNEQGIDADFRVESENNANVIFVDAGRDRIYIGKNTSDNLNTNSVTIGGSLNTSWGASLGFENDATGGVNGFILATDDSWGIGNGFGMGFGAAGSDNFRLFMKSGVTVFNERAQDIDFRVESVNNTDMLFVDASGDDVLIGNSNNNISSNEVIRLRKNFIAVSGTVGSGSNQIGVFNNTSTGGTATIEFRVAGVQKGSIAWSNSVTNYNTTSDHRLKENVVDLTGATARLNQLAPKRFNFIVDDTTTVDGFIAHEVQSVVPEAVTGTKDEVDADGNPVYQGIDQAKLVPLLVATIKELEARITALENA